MGVTIKVTDEAGVNYDIQWEDHHTLLETLQAKRCAGPRNLRW